MAYERRLFDNETLQIAYSVNLVDYAQACGYELKDGGRDAYHVKGFGGLYIFKHGRGWYRWQEGAGGDVVKFLQQMQGKTFVESIYTLLDYKNARPMETVAPKPQVREERGELVLPAKADNCKRIYYYLCSVRGLEPKIVSSMISEKRIYQQKEHGNVVFVARDKNNVPRFASVRGTGSEQFRMDLRNSDKSYAFHFGGRSDRAFVFESPIDAMSFASLEHINGLDWREHHHISLGSTADNALERYLKEHPEIQQLTFCLDNDYEGKKHDGTPCNWGQVAAARMMEKYAGLGYKVSNRTNQTKDWNDFLIEYRQISLSSVIEETTEEVLEEDMVLER